jgi:hypothetical protein
MTLGCFLIRTCIVGVAAAGLITLWAMPHSRRQFGAGRATRREDWTPEGWRRIRYIRYPLAVLAAAAVVFAVGTALGWIPGIIPC